MSRAGRRVLASALAVMLLAGCATKGQVRLLEDEVRALRVETARRDSARAAALAAVIGLQQRIFDSVTAGREALRDLDVRLAADLTEVQRQLVTVQELTGQSQRRLSELKAQVDARAEQNQAAGTIRPSAPIPAPGDTARPSAPAPGPSTVTVDQMFQGARQQLTRGALGTARRGFLELIRTYPTSELMPDALYNIGETFVVEAPDSSVAYWSRVVKDFPRSPKAATSLYKLGNLELSRNNPTAARAYYDRFLRDYPRADEADLVRARLTTLRP